MHTHDMDILRSGHPSPALADLLKQNQMGLLLESTGEGIFGIDLDGRCVFINRAGAQMIGQHLVEVFEEFC